MKKYLYCLFSLFSLFSASCRKDVLHWKTVEKIPVQGNIQLNTAIFSADGTGIIGGGTRFERAQVLVSHDKGTSWSSVQMPEDSKGFFGSCVAPDNTVYLCGLGLTIAATQDGMATYNYNRVAGPYEFTPALSFGTPDRGVAVANIKTDSGLVILFDRDLQFRSFQVFKNALHDVQMFSGRTGIVAGSGLVMKTGDGGQSWTRLPATGDNFTSIAALDSNRIFVCGLSGSILKTTDGGQSWQRLRNGGDITLPDYQLWDLLFIDELRGYAAGEKGLVIYTDDGGRHWSEFDRFTRDNLRFISLCPDGSLITGGENGSLYRLQRK
ncbi:MAG: hypothetical protein JNL13_08870 [Chitinophagaceae bacterium]|nr:hypothetical protein [Chitinophagaceae bacterium]